MNLVPSKLNYLKQRGFIFNTLKKSIMSDAAAMDVSFPKPLYENGRYKIPWNTENGKNVVRPNFARIAYGFFRAKDKPNVPSKKELDGIDCMRILPVDEEKLNAPPHQQIQATWLGHAGFYVQLGGINVLFDPVFSDTIGPIPSVGGTRRYRACAMSVDELPKVDIVCISHDHYDHCDLPSIKKIHNRFGTSVRWCMPLGLDDWIRKQLGDDVISLPFNWWDSKCVYNASGELSLNVECVPAQHWGLRGSALGSGKATDENTRLWSGWIVKAGVSTSLSVYHAGDTGYCKMFKSIGIKHGPIDLALIPIGAYCPRDVLSCQHVNTEEAVQIHEDVKARKSIAMHWGTFVMTPEYYLEPPAKLGEALDAKHIPRDSFVVLKHGQTISVPDEVNASEQNDDQCSVD